MHNKCANANNYYLEPQKSQCVSVVYGGGAGWLSPNTFLPNPCISHHLSVVLKSAPQSLHSQKPLGLCLLVSSSSHKNPAYLYQCNGSRRLLIMIFLYVAGYFYIGPQYYSGVFLYIHGCYLTHHTFLVVQ